MRKTIWFLPGLAFVLGALGSFLRWLQLLSRVEEETGFYTPGAQSVVLALYGILAVLGLAWAVSRFPGFREPLPTGYDALLLPPRLHLGLSALVGLLFLAGAALLFSESGTSEKLGTLLRVLGVLSLLSAAAAPLGVLDLRREEGPGNKSCLYAMIPLAMSCFWLITTYWEHSADPVLWDYALELLGICAVILGFYYAAGYACGRPQPRRTLLFCLLSCFFALVHLADAEALGRQLLFLASALQQMLWAIALIRRTLLTSPQD